MKVHDQAVTLGPHQSRLIRLNHPDGSFVELLTYGARLHQVVVPSAQHHLENVLYSAQELDHYRTTLAHLGAMYGPYFQHLPPIDQVDSSLFATKEWQLQQITQTANLAEVELTLSYYLEQAKALQPVSLRISFNDQHQLSYQLSILAADRLIFNAYPMLYWNLAGHQGSIAQQHLAISSDWLLQSNEQGVLSGGQTALRIVPHLNFQKSTQLCHVLALDEHKACCVKGGGIQGAYLLSAAQAVKLQLIHYASGRTLQLTGSGEMGLLMSKNRPWLVDEGLSLGAKHDALLLSLVNIPMRSSADAHTRATLLQAKQQGQYSWHYQFGLLGAT